MLTKEKREIEIKDSEIRSKQAELFMKLWMPGEEQLLSQIDAKMKKYTIKAERGYEGDAAQIHFRNAESQFHRLLTERGLGFDPYRVTAVDYVVNPALFAKFDKKRKEIVSRKTVEYESTKPILAFHGLGKLIVFSSPYLHILIYIFLLSIDEHRIDEVCEKGFSSLPSGIYFSDSYSYSSTFISKYSKLLIFQVLLGNSFQFDSEQPPKGEQIPGFDRYIYTKRIRN
jgi:hypothetical protein